VADVKLNDLGGARDRLDGVEREPVPGVDFKAGGGRGMGGALEPGQFAL